MVEDNDIEYDVVSTIHMLFHDTQSVALFKSITVGERRDCYIRLFNLLLQEHVSNTSEGFETSILI